MTKLDAALQLAAAGFWVFPIKPGQKTPAHSGWQQDASRHPEHIHNWFAHDRRGAPDDFNIGVFTGKFMDDEALIVVDVDTKNGKDGNHALLALELEGCDLPETFEVGTPTGGRHLFFRAPQAVRQGADVLGNGCDIRSRGGYVVGVGSTIGGVAYEVRADLPVAPAPGWLLARLSGPTRERAEQPAGADAALPPASAVPRAVRYLREDAPNGQGGSLSDSAYKTACRVKDFGVDRLTCIELMLEHWPHSPPMDREDMTVRVNNAFRYGLDPVGTAAPERDFTPLIPDDLSEPKDATLSPYAKINAEYAFVLSGGKRHILRETTDAEGKLELQHLDMAAFYDKLRPLKITIGKRESQLADEWMSWSGRREYDGLVFMPELEPPPRFYNLWRGFSVKPAPRGEASDAVKMFTEHAYENVARRDDVAYQYLISFFAHLVQRPYEKPLVAPVFRGRKGTGKNALIERVGALLGPHFMVVDDDRFLVSNFNDHLENKLLMVFDEAAWAGDKKAESKLKGLITGTRHNIEPKGLGTFSVANLTRVVIIGNETWVVPASNDERRFAVYDVGDGRRLDTKFFESMRLQMERGQYAHLLRFLLDWDISAFSLNIPPDTEAMLEQKHASLDPLGEWWLGSLMDGTVIGSDFAGWPQSIEKERLRQAFERYSRSRNIRGRTPSAITIGNALKSWGVGVGRKRSEGAMPYTYELPALADARACWDKFIGHKVGWGE